MFGNVRMLVYCFPTQFVRAISLKDRSLGSSWAEPFGMSLTMPCFYCWRMYEGTCIGCRCAAVGKRQLANFYVRKQGRTVDLQWREMT